MMIVVVAIIIILVIILLATTTITLRRVIQLPPRLPPRLSFLVEPALLRAQLSVPAQIRFLPVRLPILPALIRRRPAFHRPSTPIPAFASIDAAFPEPRVPGFRIDTFHLFRVFCYIRREYAIWSVSVYRCRVVLRRNRESFKEKVERTREREMFRETNHKSQEKRPKTLNTIPSSMSMLMSNSLGMPVSLCGGSSFFGIFSKMFSEADLLSLLSLFSSSSTSA